MTRVPVVTRDGEPRTTIKARKRTVQRLGELARGHQFVSIGALLDHLAKVASDKPELLREGRRA